MTPSGQRISTDRWRTIADLDSRAGAPVGNALREAAEAIEKIRHRVDRAFAEDADKWEGDHQLALEDIERIMDGEL